MRIRTAFASAPTAAEFFERVFWPGLVVDTDSFRQPCAPTDSGSSSHRRDQHAQRVGQQDVVVIEKAEVADLIGEFGRR